MQHFGDQQWLAAYGHGHRAEVSYAELEEADEAQSRSLLDGQGKCRDDGGAETGFDEGQDGGELLADVSRGQIQAG